MFPTSCHRNLFIVSLSLAGLLLGLSAACADEEPKSASDSEPEVLKIGGVVEAVNSHEISPDTEHIDSLKIKRIIEHGVRVRQGQNIVWFETEDIDKKIRDAETELRLSRLTLADDEFAHQQFLETQRLDRAAAEHRRKSAQQNYDNFVQIDRERTRKSAENNLKSSRYSLEYAMEELEQLEQMYEEDDLTEESEEIVLKRAKRAVESAQFRLEGTEIQSSRAVKQDIPRSQVEQDETLARAQLSYQKSIHDLNSARQRSEIEMKRKRDKVKETEDEFAELKAERKRVVLTSPVDGIALHGKLNRGKLSEKPSVLKEGAKVTPTTVVATVVDPTRLQIRVDLEEKNLAKVKVGVKCKVTTAAIPGFEAIGTVKSVSTVPYAGTKYDCVISIPAKQQRELLPTMTCQLEFEAPLGDKPETNKQEQEKAVKKAKKPESEKQDNPQQKSKKSDSEDKQEKDNQ